MSPRQGKKGENTPFTKQCKKKSVNDARPKQGHDTSLKLKAMQGAVHKLCKTLRGVGG